MMVRALPGAEGLLADVTAALDSSSLRQSVAAFSLFLAVVFGFDSSYFKIVSQVAILAVLLRPRLLQSLYLWAPISIMATLTLIAEWSVADNHKYLLVYWLWVVTLSCAIPDIPLAERILEGHARFFLIFVFLAAAVQKLASPTYLSGEMFEVRLLLDTRFQAFSHLLGIDQGTTDAARLAVSQLKSPFTEFANNAVRLPASDLSRWAAMAITWYDLVIQIMIGLIFIPNRRWADIAGHALLLVFIFTTYLPAPVFGFGWTLAIYGFTLSKGRFAVIQILYLVAFVAVLAYQSPWRNWVLGV